LAGALGRLSVKEVPEELIHKRIIAPEGIRPDNLFGRYVHYRRRYFLHRIDDGGNPEIIGLRLEVARAQ
jgi:hypothetical protein